MSKTMSPKDLLNFYYEKACALDVDAAMEVLHPDYHSLTSDADASRETWREPYTELAKLLSRVDREIHLVLEEAPWVNIKQSFRYEYKDGTVENFISSDYYRLEDGMLIEHQGVIVQV